MDRNLSRKTLRRRANGRLRMQKSPKVEVESTFTTHTLVMHWPDYEESLSPESKSSDTPVILPCDVASPSATLYQLQEYRQGFHSRRRK